MSDNGDLNRIHERIDDLVKGQTELQVAVARMEEKLPHSPCPCLQVHLDQHKRESEDAAKKADRFWSVASRWINPVALIAALLALAKEYIFKHP